MKGIIARALAAACLACVAAGGCESCRNWIDPCGQERYNSTARREVMDAFAPQVQNGHVLDQTVFNYHFDKGTDKLNAMGIQKLHELTQRRPYPDTTIFLATSNDFDYSPDHPETMVEGRRDMDQKRVAAIQRYLAAQLAGRPMTFEVLVHDPYEVGANGSYAAGAVRLYTAPSSGGPMGNLSQIGAAGGMGMGGNMTGYMSGGGYGGGGGGYGGGYYGAQGQGQGQGQGGATTPR